MSDPRITDEAVQAAAEVWTPFWSHRPEPRAAILKQARAALEAALPLLAAQPVVDREALAAALREHPLLIDVCRCGWRPEGRVSLRLSQHAHHQADAVLALLNGTAK